MYEDEVVEYCDVHPQQPIEKHCDDCSAWYCEECEYGIND